MAKKIDVTIVGEALFEAVNSSKITMKETMTEEELKKIPFKFHAHMSLVDEYTATYFSEDGRLGFCDHVSFKNDEPYGKVYRHYMIDGKVYKTREKFIEALKYIEI